MVTTVVVVFDRLFEIMSRPHFCNYCKNHGVMTHISHSHSKNCPWRECVCALCMQKRSQNIYRWSLCKRSDELADPSSGMMVESGPSGLASTSVATVLSAANAIPARTPTSCAAARAAKSKRLHDEEKNEETNKFVNGYVASLSETERKLPFLTNHARALKAYAEHKKNVPLPVPSTTKTYRQPSQLMSTLQLQELFPYISYPTLLQLYRDLEGTIEKMLDVLTVDQSKSDAESTSLPWSTVSSHTEKEEEEEEGGGGYFTSLDESANQKHLHDIFPQFKDIINDVFPYFSFNFVNTVDFLINLSCNASTAPIISFSSKPEDLPCLTTSSTNQLSSFLSSPTSHGSGRRPFRCPHCGHTCQISGEICFCPHCGHPLEGRPRL